MSPVNNGDFHIQSWDGTTAWLWSGCKSGPIFEVCTSNNDEIAASTAAASSHRGGGRVCGDIQLCGEMSSEFDVRRLAVRVPVFAQAARHRLRGLPDQSVRGQTRLQRHLGERTDGALPLQERLSVRLQIGRRRRRMSRIPRLRSQTEMLRSTELLRNVRHPLADSAVHSDHCLGRHHDRPSRCTMRRHLLDGGDVDRRGAAIVLRATPIVDHSTDENDHSPPSVLRSREARRSEKHSKSS